MFTVPSILQPFYDEQDALARGEGLDLSCDELIVLALAQAQSRPGCDFTKAAKAASGVSDQGRFIILYQDGTYKGVVEFTEFSEDTLVVFPGTVLHGMWESLNSWDDCGTLDIMYYMLICLKDVLGVDAGTLVNANINYNDCKIDLYNKSEMIAQGKLNISIEADHAC